MNILYGCVAVGNKIIADYSEHYDKSYRNVIRSMLPNISSHQSKPRELYTAERQNFDCDVLLDDGFIYICATTCNFPKDQSLVFLEYIRKKSSKLFTKWMKVVAQDVEATTERLLEDNIDMEKARKKISSIIAKAMKHQRKNNKLFFLKRWRKKKDGDNIGTKQHPVTEPPRDVIEMTKNAEIQSSTVKSEDESQQNVQILILQKEVEGVKDVMCSNIEQVLKRGETLEDLATRADDLLVAAEQFHKTGKKLKRKKRWKYIRISICIGATVIVLAVVVVMIPVGIVLL